MNNAGTGGYAPFTETSAAALDALLAVHFKGPFLLTQQLLPLLADGGRIVNLSSGLARYVSPGFSAYAAAKGALEVLTCALALELGPRRICPDLQKAVAAETPLGRVGEPRTSRESLLRSSPRRRAGSPVSASR